MRKLTKNLVVASLSLVGLGGMSVVVDAQQRADRKPVVKPKQLPEHRNAKGQLVCPVMGSAIASASKASGYSDHDGRRYFFCCGGCKPAFDKDPGKYSRPLAMVQESPKAANTDDGTKTVQAGKYVIELWVPDEGVHAGEEIDIEFGVFDSTKKERDGGLAGVPDVTAKAVVTMPSMEGMPKQRPHIHREGRAGVQGLELFFPHGGEYKIALTLTPKGERPVQANFMVEVKDERPADAVRKAPYALQVVDFPAHAMPGKPVDLKLRVVDTKTGQVVRNFDVAHEQRFHLLLASRDLTHFRHEHPHMAADGTWTYRATFPTGGDWWVYGDVAPTGKGSRILVQKVSLHGPARPGRMAAKNAGPFTDRGLTGRIEPVGGKIPIGKMATVRVRLTDARTGKPAGDTQPWLGAAGHLMIIHEDGRTVVHSHPQDDPSTKALVKKGQVLFTGRFPKPGRYFAYAQFKRAGEVKTLGFTLPVK